MKLLLRRPERDDLDIAVDWISDPVFREFLYGGDERIAVKGIQVLVGMLGGVLAAQVNPGGYFLIESPDAGIVGIISFQDVAWRNRSCAIDVYLAPNHRTDALSAAVYATGLAYAFDELNLHRATVRVEAGNAALQGVLEQLGAVREVTLRNHILRDGIGHDIVEYGMLRSEHEARRPRTSGEVGAVHGA